MNCVSCGEHCDREGEEPETRYLERGNYCKACHEKCNPWAVKRRYKEPSYEDARALEESIDAHTPLPEAHISL